MTRKNIPGIVAVFETLLLFAMGVMGNKIAEGLRISPVALVTITGVGLAAMAIISYFNSLRTELHIPSFSFPRKAREDSEPAPQAPSKSGKVRLMPRTMLGVFPLGIMLGLICGLTLPGLLNFLNQWFSISISIPYWDDLAFTSSLSDAEALGAYIGGIASVLSAVLLDGYLGAALSLGFGLAFPVTLVYAEGVHDAAATFFGHLLGFIFIGVLLILISPLASKARPGLFRMLQNIGPLLQKVKKVITQQRI